MKYIKTFESYNSELNSELIEEGWKEWLTAGLITLSSIAGFYKLDKNLEQNDKARKEYAIKVDKAIDNMSEDQIKQLINDFNSSDHGITDPNINIGGHIGDDGKFHSGDESFDSKEEYIEFLKHELTDKANEKPEDFLISKDGKTVRLSDDLVKTKGKW